MKEPPDDGEDAETRELVETLFRTEEMLRQLQRMDEFGRLASGIAHDFNNVIQVIMTVVSLAMGKVHPKDPAREEIREIAKAAKHAAGLTRPLLAYVRGQPSTPRLVDPNEVIAGMEAMFRRMLEENIELTTSLTTTPWVSADPLALEQVIMNLVVNARDAMPDGGKLVLATFQVEHDAAFPGPSPGIIPAPHVVVAVSDTGVGMDRETLARAFEPLFTTKPRGKGTGLGLWNVDTVIRRLGGSVSVESQVGVGTTFRLHLPAAEPPSGPVTPDEYPPQPMERAHATILVVDDEEALLRALAATLRRHGYNALAARGAGEALLRAEQHTGEIDLLLTDVIMPLLDGQRLADRLRSTRPNMKVIFMSGYPFDVVERHVQLSPSERSIEKPFTTALLLARVRDVLRGVV